MTDPRDRKRESRERAKRDAADPAKAAELRRMRKRLANATRREAERQRLREALSTVRAWAQPWPPLTERMRHARDEARMWRAIVILEVES